MKIITPQTTLRIADSTTKQSRRAPLMKRGQNSKTKLSNSQWPWGSSNMRKSQVRGVSQPLRIPITHSKAPFRPPRVTRLRLEPWIKANIKTRHPKQHPSYPPRTSYSNSSKKREWRSNPRKENWTSESHLGNKSPRIANTWRIRAQLPTWNPMARAQNKIYSQRSTITKISWRKLTVDKM